MTAAVRHATLSRHECASLINLARNEKQVAKIMGANPGLSSPVRLWRHARQRIIEGATL